MSFATQCIPGVCRQRPQPLQAKPSAHDTSFCMLPCRRSRVRMVHHAQGVGEDEGTTPARLSDAARRGFVGFSRRARVCYPRLSAQTVSRALLENVAYKATGRHVVVSGLLAKDEIPTAGCGVTGAVITSHRGTKYRLIKLLGKGGFGKVYSAQEIETGTMVAVKVMPKALGLVEDAAVVKHERDVLARVTEAGGKFLIRLHEAFAEKKLCFFVMPLMESDFRAVLAQYPGGVPDATAGYYFAQMVLAVGFVHSLDITHNDLKPENFLVSQHRLVLTDFGLAHRYSSVEKIIFVGGTPGYQPPEVVLAQKEVTYSADVWALGVILLELTIGMNPFHLPNDHIQDIIAKTIDERALSIRTFIGRSGLSPCVHALVDNLLVRDPGRRYTILEIMDAQWLSWVDWGGLTDMAGDAPVAAYRPSPVQQPPAFPEFHTWQKRNYQFILQQLLRGVSNPLDDFEPYPPVCYPIPMIGPSHSDLDCQQLSGNTPQMPTGSSQHPSEISQFAPPDLSAFSELSSLTSSLPTSFVGKSTPISDAGSLAKLPVAHSDSSSASSDHAVGRGSLTSEFVTAGSRSSEVQSGESSHSSRPQHTSFTSQTSQPTHFSDTRRHGSLVAKLLEYLSSSSSSPSISSGHSPSFLVAVAYSPVAFKSAGEKCISPLGDTQISSDSPQQPSTCASSPGAATPAPIAQPLGNTAKAPLTAVGSLIEHASQTALGSLVLGALEALAATCWRCLRMFAWLA